MATETITTQIYKKQADGTMQLVDTYTEEVEMPTQEELIAEKEAALLAMYAELEALKNNA